MQSITEHVIKYTEYVYNLQTIKILSLLLFFHLLLMHGIMVYYLILELLCVA